MKYQSGTLPAFSCAARVAALKNLRMRMLQRLRLESEVAD